jgi:hypothetical protein
LLGRSEAPPTRSCDKGQREMKNVVEVRVMLRPTANRPVYLGVRHLSEPHDQIVSTVRQLRICRCGAPSPTIGLVCSLQLLLGLGSAVIHGFESHRTHDHILLFQIRESPILEGQ